LREQWFERFHDDEQKNDESGALDFHGVGFRGAEVVVEELREMVRDAVHCHFSDRVPGPMPKIIRLHFVRDEALAVGKSPATSTHPISSAPWGFSVRSRCAKAVPISV
jgi:hypothetical protein